MCRGALLLQYVAVGLAAATGRAAADPVALPRGDVLLRADCYRFRQGARNHEGLGSMFRNVRGIYYLAHILGINTTVALNVPTTGHGGDFEATRRFLTGPRAPALAEDAATAVSVPEDVQARIGAWFEFGGASKAARRAAPAATFCEARDACREQLFACAQVPHALRTEVFGARDALRQRAQHDGKQHVLDINLCPTLTFDYFFLPEVDRQLQRDMAELRALRKRKLQSQPDNLASAKAHRDSSTQQEGRTPNKAQCTAEGRREKVTIAVHHRTGDLMESLFLPRGESGVVSEECRSYLQRQRVTKADILTTIAESFYTTSAGVDASEVEHMQEHAELDWCAWERQFSPSAGEPRMLYCCNDDEVREGGTRTGRRRSERFSMRRYAQVVEGIVEQVRRKEQCSRSKIEIRLFSQAPAHLYNAWQQRLSATLPDVDVVVHGGGDGRSLVAASASAGAGALPELDRMAEADVLVIGEGNLSRLAGYLNARGVVVQLEGCGRSGKLAGDRVADAGEELGAAAFDAALDAAWSRRRCEA